MRLTILLLLFVQQAFSAYSYYISHTVVSSKVVSGAHTDFPVLIDTTSNDLRTTGNGGYVTNSSGYDIQPASDAACTSFLSFERESYSASTGQVRMHVKVSSLSTSTVVYLCFADSGVTTDQAAPTSVWNSGYKAVYHFGDGSTLSLADSTSNANTLTNNNTVTADASGKIYGAAAQASASSQYLSNSSAVLTTTPMTFTAWAKSATTSGVQTVFAIEKSGTSGWYRLILYQSKVQNQLQVESGGGNALASTSANYSTSNWFHTATVFGSATSRTVYLDGGSSGTSTTSLTQTGLNLSSTRTLGASGEYFNGSIDELRISNVARSAGWIETEYNAGTPSSFWTVGGTTSLNARRRLLIQ